MPQFVVDAIDEIDRLLALPVSAGVEDHVMVGVFRTGLAATVLQVSAIARKRERERERERVCLASMKDFVL